MPDALRDPVWQFIGAVLAFAAIVISILLYSIQRRRKALSYEIVSSTPLLSMEDEVRGKLQILFDGTQVQDVHLIILRLMNTGNVPILTTDFELPVRISFGTNTQILTSEVLEVSPDNLNASINIEDIGVVLAPLLLNTGDSTTIKTLVSQFSKKISIDGRIVGVKKIKEAVEGRTQFYIMTLFGMVMSVIGVFFWIRSLPPSTPVEVPLTKTLHEGWPHFLLFFLGYILMLIGILRYSRMRRFFRDIFNK